MRRVVWAALALVVMLVPLVAAGQDADTTRAGDDSFLERLSRPKLERWGFIYLPKIYYGSETSVGFGGQLLRPFSGAGFGDSEVEIKGRYMVKGQGEAGLTPLLTWGGGHYAAKAKIEFTNIPRRFYGVGPDTPSDAEEDFQRQSLLSYLELMRRVGPRLRVGLRGEVERARMLASEPDGLFATASIPGFEPSTVIGWGVLADYDTRDHRYWPTTGSFHQAFFMKFDDGVQSDHNFDVYYAELRRYFTTATNHVLALQAFMYSTDGAPPFWRLAELGGRAHSRGYDKGRYRDRALIAFQAEHRFAVWRRLGLVGFAGLSDVAPRLGSMELEHMRHTVGGGVRFRISNGTKRVNARLDVAFGQELQLYFKLGEAF